MRPPHLCRNPLGEGAKRDTTGPVIREPLGGAGGSTVGARVGGLVSGCGMGVRSRETQILPESPLSHHGHQILAREDDSEGIAIAGGQIGEIFHIAAHEIVIALGEQHIDLLGRHLGPDQGPATLEFGCGDGGVHAFVKLVASRAGICGWRHLNAAARKRKGGRVRSVIGRSPARPRPDRARASRHPAACVGGWVMGSWRSFMIRYQASRVMAGACLKVGDVEANPVLVLAKHILQIQETKAKITF